MRGDERLATHVVFVHPEIHWNTGNIGRTCLATGATLHLIKPLGFSLDERQVKRAGLDYWEHVDLRVWSSWEAFEAVLPTLGEAYFFATQATNLFWDAYFKFAEDKGVKTVRVPLKPDYSHDFVAMEAAITPTTSLVSVCNPNNPTGQ